MNTIDDEVNGEERNDYIDGKTSSEIVYCFNESAYAKDEKKPDYKAGVDALAELGLSDEGIVSALDKYLIKRSQVPVCLYRAGWSLKRAKTAYEKSGISDYASSLHNAFSHIRKRNGMR
jgi:tetrahydromethanopterin S-methyltransferase subunit H